MYQSVCRLSLARSSRTFLHLSPDLEQVTADHSLGHLQVSLIPLLSSSIQFKDIRSTYSVISINSSKRFMCFCSWFSRVSNKTWCLLPALWQQGKTQLTHGAATDETARLELSFHHSLRVITWIHRNWFMRQTILAQEYQSQNSTVWPRTINSTAGQVPAQIFTVSLADIFFVFRWALDCSQWWTEKHVEKW